MFADGRAAPSRGLSPSCLHVSILSVISSHTFFPQLLRSSPSRTNTNSRREVGRVWFFCVQDWKAKQGFKSTANIADRFITSVSLMTLAFLLSSFKATGNLSVITSRWFTGSFFDPSVVPLWWERPEQPTGCVWLMSAWDILSAWRSQIVMQERSVYLQ